MSVTFLYRECALPATVVRLWEAAEVVLMIDTGGITGIPKDVKQRRTSILTPSLQATGGDIWVGVDGVPAEVGRGILLKDGAPAIDAPCPWHKLSFIRAGAAGTIHMNLKGF